MVNHQRHRVATTTTTPNGRGKERKKEQSRCIQFCLEGRGDDDAVIQFGFKIANCVRRSMLRRRDVLSNMGGNPRKREMKCTRPVSSL